MPPQRLGAWHRRRREIAVPGRAGDEHPAPGVSGGVEQPGRLAVVGCERRAQPVIERGGKRQLIARIDLQPIGQGARSTSQPGVAAEELVYGRQLTTDAHARFHGSSGLPT